MSQILPFAQTVIDTPRLNLRPVTLNDVEQIYGNWASDDEVTKYLSWDTHPSPDETRRVVTSWLLMYEKPTFYLWVITLRENSQVIGTISFFDIKMDLLLGEIGYCISRSYWNMGIATEALIGVLEYAFDQNTFQAMIATHLFENPASGRVMEKAGMKYLGDIFRNNKKPHQSGVLKCYKITKENWDRRKR